MTRLPVFAFHYVWEPPEMVRVGVMADEVARLHPEALGPTVNGFMTVAYHRLPQDVHLRIAVAERRLGVPRERSSVHWTGWRADIGTRPASPSRRCCSGA